MEKIEIKQIRINPNYFDEECTKHLLQAGFKLMTEEELTAANNKVIYTIIIPDEVNV